MNTRLKWFVVIAALAAALSLSITGEAQASVPACGPFWGDDSEFRGSCSGETPGDPGGGGGVL